MRVPLMGGEAGQAGFLFLLTRLTFSFILMRAGDPYRFFVCVQSVCTVRGYGFRTPNGGFYLFPLYADYSVYGLGYICPKGH